MLDFLNLPWDDRCLSFHENKRAVTTASRDQVKQPLYSSSVGRWRKYEKKIPQLMGLSPGKFSIHRRDAEHAEKSDMNE
jgi:hypothetical protein